MVTVFVYAVLALVVVAALVALAVLVLPGTEQLAPAAADRTPWALPAERSMTGPDVGRLRLPVTLRGYRFAETDAVLDRLGEEIAYRDTVIATLQAELDGRSPYADPAAEVLLDADAELDPQGDADELVELGETPEETEHEVVGDALPEVVDDVPELDIDAPVDVVEVVAVEVIEVAPIVEAAVAEPEPEPAPEPELGPRVVELDDDLPEFGERDDTPPDGPAARS